MLKSFLKATTILYEVDNLSEEMPEELVRNNRKRLNAFYAALESIQVQHRQYVLHYTFYSLKPPKRLTKVQLRKQWEELSPTIRTLDFQNLSIMKNKEVILYGNCELPEKQEQVEAFLKKQGLEKAPYPPFYDATNAQSSPYTELQKAAFFCKKRECILLFINLGQMINDICFYNILEECSIEFHCIDFPWLRRENLRLMKAMALYNRMENNF